MRWEASLSEKVGSLALPSGVLASPCSISDDGLLSLPADRCDSQTTWLVQAGWASTQASRVPDPHMLSVRGTGVHGEAGSLPSQPESRPRPLHKGHFFFIFVVFK